MCVTEIPSSINARRGQVITSAAANHGQQRFEPAARCLGQQQVRNELAEEQDFDDEVDEQLRQRVPARGNRKNHASRGLDGHEHQRQLREDRKTQRRVPPRQLQVRLDLRLENLQMLVRLSGGHSSEFAIDAIQVRE